MPLSTATLIFALLAVAGILFLIWIGVLAILGRVSDPVADSFDTIRERLSRWVLPAAFTVAFIATFGSLYFSETVGFEPCRLCWYQRIAMYPLVPILAIATSRRDLNVRWYAIPLALIGAVIASYHYFLEWFPQADAGACKVGIPCTVVWFRELGFVSIPFLALVAFLLVIALLLIPLRNRPTEDDAEA